MGSDIARYRVLPLIAGQGWPRVDVGERGAITCQFLGDRAERRHVVRIEFLAMNAWRLQAPTPSLNGQVDAAAPPAPGCPASLAAAPGDPGAFLVPWSIHVHILAAIPAFLIDPVSPPPALNLDTFSPRAE